MRDRSEDTGRALVEVRTVHSRARTALATVRRSVEGWRDPNQPDWDRAGGETWEQWNARSWITFYDEDRDDMIAALEKAVALLERWAR